MHERHTSPHPSPSASPSDFRKSPQQKKLCVSRPSIWARTKHRIGLEDPTFVHVSVPKVIRGVAPAQLRGDRAGVFCQRNISHQGATVMNNGEEKHIELLTVQETAKLLKVPVSWVYGHTRKRSIDPLPGYRLGKYWRFREDEVLAWVVRQPRNDARLCGHADRNNAIAPRAFHTGHHARDLFARDPGRATSRGRKRRAPCIWTQMDPSSGSDADHVK